MAEELGITVAQVAAIGWSETTVPTTTSEAYAVEVDDLGQAIRAYRRAEGGRLLPTDPNGGESGDADADGEDEEDREAKKRRNGVALLCPCQPVARHIRLALSVAEAGPITCGICGHDFTDPDTSTNDTHDNDEDDTDQDEEA